MKVNAKQYGQALYEVTRDQKGAALTQVVEQFVRLLAGRNLLGKTEQIITEFKKQYNQAQGIIEVYVRSAEVLNETEVKKISKALEEITEKKVEIIATVDPTLIGGVVIQIGDTVITHNFKSHLEHLKTVLAA